MRQLVPALLAPLALTLTTAACGSQADPDYQGESLGMTQHLGKHW